MSESAEVQIARIDERTTAHALADSAVHGRMLGEVVGISDKVDALNERVAVLAATLGPIVDLYMSEHPSKVTRVPISKPPPSTSYKIEAKKLGMLIGGILVFLETWAHVRTALAGWLTHR